MDAPAPAPVLLHLADDAATRRLGEDMVLMLRQGDVVALSGDLGAGKSTLARAMIRAHADDADLDVPSPTYTLVQTYDTAPPIAHFDLYRLSEASEIDELGFDEAAEAGIVLCEWPERAPAVVSAASLRVELSIDGDGRRAEIFGTPQALRRLRRTLAVRAFLDAENLPVTHRRRFFGDASPRRYESVLRGGHPALLMDAPRQTQGLPVQDGLPYARIAHIAEDVSPFVAVAKALRAEGFAAPEIYAADLDQGFVLIEHLGGGTVLDTEGLPIPERYEAAALMLAELHAKRWDRALPVEGDTFHTVPDFDRRAMAIEVGLLLDWYFPRMRGAPATAEERAEYTSVWADLFDTLREAETSLVLRDLHSPNIVWRGERAGLDRIGLVDFQDAMIGPSAYDLASLAQDARVDVAPELEMRLVAAYAAARRAQGSFDGYAFERDYAIMAAQRASKILGIFVRLDERDGKPQYLRHIPRLKGYLARTLDHPALAALQSLYSRWGLLGDDAPKRR
jgi:tRNA threonylcarbamoyl adenosine modification protein YjeE